MFKPKQNKCSRNFKSTGKPYIFFIIFFTLHYNRKFRNLKSDETESANILNDYFASVFEVEENDRIPDFEECNYDPLLVYIEINEEKILKKYINALKTNKS